MGCWNGTCGLSQLPIKAGDPVVGFLLEQESKETDFGGGFCYSNGLWSPLFIPLVGKYDDYGRIEEIEKGSEALVKFFNEEKTIKLISRHKGDDAPSAPKDIEELVGFVERGQYSFEWHPKYGKGIIGLTMIHKAVFDAAVEEFGSRVPYKQEKTYKELLAERTRRKLDELLAPVDEEDELASIKKIMRRMDEWPFRHDDGQYNKYLFDRISENPDLDRDKLVEMLVNFNLIRCVFDAMRKAWMPQTGAGSQSSEYKLHKVVFEAVEKVVLADANKYEEYNGETLDEIWSTEDPWWRARD